MVLGGVASSGLRSRPVPYGRGGFTAPKLAKRPRHIMQPPAPPPVAGDQGGSEEYKNYGTNPMIETATDHLSTFAIDVDTASFAIARTKILGGTLPPTSAVRVEEFVNYFHYNYPGPTDKKPFAVHMDGAPSPFEAGRYLLRVGVQAKKLSKAERKPANLVFLVDVSGSMNSPNKLPLAKRALRVLVDNLNDGDTVSLVTYAGNTRVVLEPTALSNKGAIMSAIDDLQAAGSTAMSSGLDLAYQLAANNLSPKTLSRVIVLSDGDANVGARGYQAILKQIASKVKEGVTLTTVGLGMGNYKDHMMEQLANKGNGNYVYIDTISEARKVFQEQLGGTLDVVAKDVKIQVDFDKNAVRRYRLVGYENRDIADRDFRNDRVDAGEIGAGHTVTAIYAVELVKGNQAPLATVRIRAKQPRGETAKEFAFVFDSSFLSEDFTKASTDFRFAIAVIGAAEILRGSEHAKEWSLAEVIRVARNALGENRGNERSDFVRLMSKARSLQLAMARR